VLAGEKPSDRQQAMLNRLLDRFKGKLTSSKETIIAKTSQTAVAWDIDDLTTRDISRKGEAGGRNTDYCFCR